MPRRRGNGRDAADPQQGHDLATAGLTILDCIDHPMIWAGRFDANRPSWRPWRTFLATLFHLPVTYPDDIALVQQCTGRTALDRAFLEAWLVVGRRGGKSFVLALIACYLAIFRDWTPYLSRGERGTIKIIAGDRAQARIIYDHCRALLTDVPDFASMILRDDKDTIELSNAITIEVQTASFRTVRGYTIITALLDEIGFWRTDEGFANPDAEIIAALRPAMLTVPGAMLLAASSPYAKRGQLWDAYRKYWGRDDASMLVWRAATRTMNPSASQDFIDAEYERDPASAEAEYGAQFRSDIESYLAREVVEAAIVPGRHELAPILGQSYAAFIDPSGGSGDSFTLAIAHRDKDGRGILDALREVRPPFSPEAVVAEFSDTLRDYRVTRVRGDRYTGEWPREQFRKRGVTYETADHPKTDLYRDFLPLINSGKVELLDHPRLTAQLCSLERRTSRGTGKDSIDHPTGPAWHDDLANACAGALTLVAGRRGPMKFTDDFVRRSAIPLPRLAPSR